MLTCFMFCLFQCVSLHCHRGMLETEGRERPWTVHPKIRYNTFTHLDFYPQIVINVLEVFVSNFESIFECRFSVSDSSQPTDTAYIHCS